MVELTVCEKHIRSSEKNILPSIHQTSGRVISDVKLGAVEGRWIHHSRRSASKNNQHLPYGYLPLSMLSFCSGNLTSTIYLT